MLGGVVQSDPYKAYIQIRSCLGTAAIVSCKKTHLERKKMWRWWKTEELEIIEE